MRVTSSSRSAESERSMNEISSGARSRTVNTSHGVLAVEERGEHGLPVLFIHGNSSCRAVFDAQMNGPLAAQHRLIAIDLPGHGESGDAFDPIRTYTRPGLAEAIGEALEKLDVREIVVVGWSLGGHVAIQMLAASTKIRGLMIVGAPPIGPDGWAQGFVQSPHPSLAARQDWSAADADAFLTTILGRLPEQRLRDAALRTDGRMRKRLFEAARAGLGVDQRRTVESSRIPLAVVNGAADPLIKLDYFDTVAYANLWEGRCHRLPGAGHAPFWEAPDEFAPLLQRFLLDIRRHSAPAESTPNDSTRSDVVSPE